MPRLKMEETPVIMKYFHLTICFMFVIVINCTSNTQTSKQNSESSGSNTAQSCKNYDSVLMRYASDFEAKSIQLNESLSKELSTFIISLDSNCLRKQRTYKKFLSTILGKLAFYHLKCCNQSYDLYQMNGDAAKVMVREFNRTAGYESEDLEMLQSGTVVDFLKRDGALSKDSTLRKIILDIEKEQMRIRKGIFDN